MKKKAFTGKRRERIAGISEKIVNILKVLSLIEQKRFLSADEIAEECEIARRTVFRYINILNSIIPIEYDRQKKGYRFFNEKALRVVPFSKEEIAIIAAMSEISSRLGTSLKEGFKGILDKFIAVSSDSAKGMSSEKLFSLIMPGTAKESWENFEAIARAIMEQKMLKIIYNATNTRERTERTVEPYGMAFYDGIWFLYAFCRLRNDFRWFALDRIESLTVLDAAFKRPEGFDIRERLKERWGIWGGKETVVRARFSKEIAEVIKRKIWHKSETKKPLRNGDIELSFKVSGTEEIKWWLYSWIPHVEVLEPRSLREEMKNDIKKTLSILK